jgi:type IV pilus assembly protein PilN
MRVTLNLASKPYVELRPLYQRLRVIIAVLALFAIAFWYVWRMEYTKAQAAQARVDAIQASVNQEQNERQQHEADMKLPKNAAVLNQAEFLNNLFLRKAFSWTAVMIDLEHVLPAGVQVLNIDPVVSKDGNVSVRLRVLGPHDRAVDLVRNLEKSRRFLAPRLVAETAESNTAGTNTLQTVASNPKVNFDIVADYNPLPIKPPAASKEDGAVGTPSGSKSATPHAAHPGKTRRHAKPAATNPSPSPYGGTR